MRPETTCYELSTFLNVSTLTSLSISLKYNYNPKYCKTYKTNVNALTSTYHINNPEEGGGAFWFLNLLKKKWKYKPFDLWGVSLTCNLLCETWTRSYSVVSHHTAIERWKCIKSYRYTRLKICVWRFSMRRLIIKTFLLHHVMNYD